MDEEQRPVERGATVLLTRSAAQGAAFARALAEEWEAERAAKPSARESTSEETREGDNGEGPRDPSQDRLRNAAAPRVLFAPLQQARTVPATEELRGVPALLESGVYAWVSFTSAHTVRACAELWGEDFTRAVHSGGARIACVGAATARAVRAQLGLDADFQPSVQSAAGMLAELEGPAAGAVSSEPASTEPATVLVLEGSNARPTLREGLKNLGWSVTARVLYDMVPAERVEPGELSLSAARALLRGADAPNPDVIVATAPSRLHALLDGAPALGPESVPPVVAIGATTASACRALNLRHVQADSPSPRDLARAAVSLI
ncbi:uroporphyrinogen-III synthase [Rothia sp. HMSC072E10]|uniref:uroporphyrinogen-III synthase n=1 Tax=Rothia sp. HMSC072E10 TaxID=1739448 RepID=UPI0008A653D8|nr:uroporphyrinogen-III synthase [Rothia sp. HMSC072E10]OFQ30361.1 uroporphyrinogen-III synthase [Rothia sp. HMSC072E10]